MRLGEGVEWAAHCLVVLALLPAEATLTAGTLAEYHGIPGPYLAKCLQALARDGLVSSLPGRGGGYRLRRAASEITLLDVVRAVEGDEPLFRCTEIRRRGPSRVAARQYPPLCAIADAMGRAEAAWAAELERTTVAQLVAAVRRQAPAAATGRAAAWLGTRVTLRPATPSG